MNMKTVSAGAGLFGLGALFGWAITADRYERRLDQIIERQEVLEERLAYLRKRLDRSSASHIEDSIQYKRALERANDELARLKGEDEKTPEGSSDETSENVEVDDEASEVVRSNLQGLIDKYSHNEEADSVNRMINAAETMTKERTPPFVISRDRYSWDEEEGDYYAKTTLTYFPRHRMLLDDEEDPVADVANTVGWRNLSQFGGESGDPDVVFVRNRSMMSDFEIVRDNESELPLHIKYGMGRDEFQTSKAAGIIKLRPEDRE